MGERDATYGRQGRLFGSLARKSVIGEDLWNPPGRERSKKIAQGHGKARLVYVKKRGGKKGINRKEKLGNKNANAIEVRMKTSWALNQTMRKKKTISGVEEKR